MIKELKRARAEVKVSGLRGAAKVLGWKILAAVFVFYLIRDTLLYIGIPLAIKAFAGLGS